jgi:hypothetical protein
MGVGGQCHAPAALPPRNRSGTHCIGVWMGPRASLDDCRKCRPPMGFDLRIAQPVASRYFTIEFTVLKEMRNFNSVN